MAKVSIIVPVHNTEKYLRTCVRSIQEQTLKDIEIILVENASTDNSLALCGELAAEDNRIRYISLEMGDLSNARNEGVKVAKGDFVGFVDSDDTIAPEMYEMLYDAAIKNGAEVADCNYMKVYPDRPDKRLFKDTGKEIVFSSKDMLAEIFKRKISVSACTFIVKREIAEKVLFPVGRTIEDKATTYRFCAEASRGVLINRSFYFYHQYRGDIMSASKTFRRSSDWELTDKEILSFIESYPYFTAQEKCRVSAKTSQSIVRQLDRMRRTASTEEEKAIYRERKKDLALIPEGSLKIPRLLLLVFLMTHSIGTF